MTNQGHILNYSKWKIFESEDPEIWLDYKSFYKHLQEGGIGLINWTQKGCVWCMKLEDEVFDTIQFANWCKENNIKGINLRPEDKDLEKIKDKLRSKLEGTPDVRIVKLAKTGSLESINKEQKIGYMPGGAEHWIKSIDLSKF